MEFFTALYKRLCEAQNTGYEIEIEEDEVLKVCNRFNECYAGESSVVDLTSDNIAIVGDVHGQFYDVLNYFKTLGFPDTQPYVFLGDYCDRGI